MSDWEDNFEDKSFTLKPQFENRRNERSQNDDRRNDGDSRRTQNQNSVGNMISKFSDANVEVEMKEDEKREETKIDSNNNFEPEIDNSDGVSVFKLFDQYL